MLEGSNEVIIANVTFKKVKQKGKGFGHKCLSVLVLFIFGALIYGCIMGGLNDITMLLTLDSYPLYVKERSFVIAFVLLIPTSISLIFIILLGLFDFLNDRLVLFFAKSGMWAFPLFLVASVAINYVAEQHLQDHGYSYCYWYTGKTMGSPDIWVRSPEYCQQSKNSVIFDMFIWLDKRVAENNEPTPAEIDVFLTEGLKAHKKKFSSIYDD